MSTCRNLWSHESILTDKDILNYITLTIHNVQSIDVLDIKRDDIRSVCEAMVLSFAEKIESVIRKAVKMCERCFWHELYVTTQGRANDVLK